MKKIIFTLAFIALIIMSTSLSSKATTVTFYVNITISDTCHPTGYTGRYCVQLKLTFKNITLCTKSICNLGQGSQCVHFDCSVTGQESDCDYQITVLTGSRADGTCGTTLNIASPNSCWDQITDNTCPVAVSITI